MKMAALMIASLWIAGCAAQARSPEPVPVDRVECARCRMLLSSEAGAAQIVSTRDETRFYDDVGCLAADWSERLRRGASAAGTSTPFVHLRGGGWRDARTAWFARPPAAHTAMGSGLVAYESADEAKAADRDARALGWDEVTR